MTRAAETDAETDADGDAGAGNGIGNGTGAPPAGPLAGRASQPIFVREVLAEARAVRFETRRQRPLAHGAIALLSVMRNEAAILGAFLAHYRALGVARFIVLDNASSDGTAERLMAEPDVDLHIVRRAFRSHRKQGWLNRAIALYGHDRWYLHADADEHLVFDGMEARGLAGLARLAEAGGLRRLRGMLVDMYPEGPLFAPAGDGAQDAPACQQDAQDAPACDGAQDAPACQQGAQDAPAGTLAGRFPLFDGAGYAELVCKQRISRKGGPRKRLLAARGLDFDPEMTKYPLFHIREGEVFDNPHHLHPYAENFVSPCHLGLLHYKFNDGFAAKVAEAVAEGSYFNASAEYRVYQQALKAGRAPVLAHAGSRRYAGPADLLAAGLIAPLPWERASWERASPAASSRSLLARARRLFGR